MIKKQAITLIDTAKEKRRDVLESRKLLVHELSLVTELEKSIASVLATKTEEARKKRRGGKQDFPIVGGILREPLRYVDTLNWDNFLDDDDLVQSCAEQLGMAASEILAFTCTKCNPSNLRAMHQAWQKWFFREQLQQLSVEKDSSSYQAIAKVFLEYKSDLKKMHTQELETAKQQSYATGKKDFHRKGALVVNANSAKKVRARIDWYKLNFKTTPSIDSKRKGQIANVSEMTQTLADKFNVSTETAKNSVQSARRELRQEGVIR